MGQDFAGLTNAQLVSAFNGMVKEAVEAGLQGWWETARFKDAQAGMRRCEMIESSLRAFRDGQEKGKAVEERSKPGGEEDNIPEFLKVRNRKPLTPDQEAKLKAQKENDMARRRQVEKVEEEAVQDKSPEVEDKAQAQAQIGEEDGEFTHQAIFDEVVKVLKVKPKVGEDAEAFTRRAEAKGQKASEDDWADLSQEAQEFLNSVSTAIDESKEIPLLLTEEEIAQWSKADDHAGKSAASGASAGVVRKPRVVADAKAKPAKVAKPPKAAKEGAPRVFAVAGRRKDGSKTVGYVANVVLLQGGTVAEALEAVMDEFPDCKSNLGCVNWYKMALKKNGLLDGAGKVTVEGRKWLKAATGTMKDAKAGVDAQATA